MKYHRFFFSNLSVLFLVCFFLVLPVQADLIVGTGSGGAGFVEHRSVSNGADSIAHEAWPQLNWSSYNSSGNAETHPALGDLDGDGREEVVVGLSSAGNGFVEVLDDKASGFSHIRWLRVSWPGYNNENGETWPACGDVDGDGLDEIILGLGNGSSGWMEIKDDASNSFAHVDWTQVAWSDYTSASNAYTRPVASDVDDGGNDEIIVGLSDASHGWVEVKEDQSNGFSTKDWFQVSWEGYTTTEGATRPCAGDLDGDGSDEVVLGLGSGSNGWLEVKDDDFSRLDWIQVSWNDYTTGNNDGTRPGCGNLDPSDKAAELAIGLSPAGNGWMEVKEGTNEDYSKIESTQLNWSGYISSNGETYPVIDDNKQEPDWNQVSTDGPSARVFHAMAYDRKRGKVVLFGGWDGSTKLGDTWEWDGNSWELVSSSGPVDRDRHAMTYDREREKVVLFGGYDSDNDHLGDTWEWDGVSWTKVSSESDPGPSARGNHEMAYDSARERTVLYGGADSNSALADTWEWDGQAWVNAASGDFFRTSHGMAYDNARDRVVLFGGTEPSICTICEDTFGWDGNNWSTLKTRFPDGDNLRWDHAMAFDSARARVVIQGGTANAEDGFTRAVTTDETWEYDGDSWHQAAAGPRRGLHAMVYDSKRGKLVMFGGETESGEMKGDTWER